jgi:hypothetical protein
MEIRPFDSDYRQLSRMIHEAWAGEHESHIDFTETYLKFLIESPDTEPSLTLGAYQNGNLVSFVLSKKRRIFINGKEYLGLQQTLGTTRPDYAHRFPYIRLKAASIKTAVQRGYDLNYGFIAWGIKNNRIEALFAEKEGYQCNRVHSFGWLGRAPVDPVPERRVADPPSDVQLQPLEPPDADGCLEIIHRSAEACSIYQKWDKETFRQHFLQSDFCQGRIVRIGGRQTGFIGLSKFDMIKARTRKKVCFIYHLFIEEMTDPMKEGVMAAIIDEMRGEGVEVISIPHTGYFNGDYLKKLGFKAMPFKRFKTNLYITMFRKSLSYGIDEPFYLEIV